MPTKNLAVVVVANSHSQFVSNLGDVIIDMVVPELSAPAARAAPTSASVPPSVLGEWSGHILVLGHAMRLSLNITAGGVVRGKLADGPMTELRNLFIAPSRFNGELAPNRDIVAVTLTCSRQVVEVAIIGLLPEVGQCGRPGTQSSRNVTW